MDGNDESEYDPYKREIEELIEEWKELSIPELSFTDFLLIKIIKKRERLING